MYEDGTWPSSREAFFTFLLELVKQGKPEDAVAVASALVDGMDKRFPIPNKEIKLRYIEDDSPAVDDSPATPGSGAPLNTGKRWLDVNANKLFVAAAIIVTIAIAANYL